jgi:hypothetical protein
MRAMPLSIRLMRAARAARAAGGIAAAVILLFPPAAAAEDRAEKVRKDRAEVVESGHWHYNDLAAGLAEARAAGKPLLVVLRCIPCEACRGFDEQVASLDPRVRELLERFVRVRVPQANGLDLSLFQFDYDMSFYAFFLHADGTIYGRFGSRSTQEDPSGEVSIPAFREAMAAALDLHARHEEVKGSLAAKRGPPPPHGKPEDYPSLKGRYTSRLDYEGKVVQSCIHCHQIRDAERLLLRDARKPIPDAVLYPWPLPETLGLRLDPRRRATVAGVEPGTAAEKAGFKAGDDVRSLDGQPLISVADVQWVLHRAPAAGRLAARVRRGDEDLSLELPLEDGWRRRSDISWRVTTWELRRMGTGGLLLEEVSEEERAAAGIAKESLALRVRHAGEYGEHATAKNAGFRKGDIIVEVDGRSSRLSETGFVAYAVQEKLPGDRLELGVLRGKERLRLSFRLQ